MRQMSATLRTAVPSAGRCRVLPRRVLGLAVVFLVGALCLVVLHSRTVINSWWGRRFNGASGNMQCYPVGNMPPAGARRAAKNLTLNLQPGWRASAKQVLVDVMVFPREKQLLCTIPKAGCTVLRSLSVAQATGLHIEPKDAGGVSRVHWFAAYRQLQLKDFSDEHSAQWMGDPQWRYSAVVRHPLTRILSGYLDKLQQDQEYFRPPFKGRRVNSFREFVEVLEVEARQRPDGLDNTDEHWRTQSTYCFFRVLPRAAFDDVVRLEDADQIARLYVELFGEHGARWVTTQRRKDGTAKGTTSSHARSAAAKLEANVDEELARRVQQLYKEDYERFGYDLWPPS
ncbi:hypothetical protein CDCA_CDCA02G0675 [Cyanidium caldarium]|uniref:Uncharacterized protein n=1 Tax=Cyanidium caldarium TaxID=2771 RepID=A0AAV9IQR7_CYACA|nr:hypothetical protein CDCA_CDCA02G0675 [Cyanidium caldarium]